MVSESDEKDLKRRLIGAALAALSEEGAGDLSLREVARRAGVSHNAPYHHFPGGKVALLADTAREGFVRLRSEIVDRTGDVPGAARSARWQLEEMAAVYVGFAYDNPALYRVMFSAEVAAAPQTLIGDAIASLYGVFRAAFVQARADATVPDGAPVDDLATAYTTMLHGLAIGVIDGLVARSAPDRARAEALAKRLAGAVLGPHQPG
jgi:AcrR family transcriptional regulator